MFALVTVALGVQPAASAPRAPVSLNGAAALRPVDFGEQCLRADAGAAQVMECSQGGAYRGGPLRGTATYTWHWHLFEGGDVPQTASGHEDGIVQLRLGTRGTARLLLRGIKEGGATAGTWRYVRGTKQLARRTGSGTYRFETTAGDGGFRTARLLLRGSLR